VARIQPNPGLGATAGYSFTYQHNNHDVQISKITGEMWTAVPGTSKSLTLDPAKKYRFVFQGKDQHLEGRIYDLADLTTPVIVVQGQDATYANGFPACSCMTTVTAWLAPTRRSTISCPRAPHP